MAKGGEITKYMIEEHGKILTLLANFKKNAYNEKAVESFKELKDKQDNHVFAEERAIMMLIKEGKKFKDITTILKQHEELHDIVRALNEKIEKGLGEFDFNLKNLLELMKVHIVLENSSFYPELDKNLAADQKKMILSKIKEVIIGNIRM